MLTIDNLNENNVLTITAKGKLTKENFLHLKPELESLLEQNGDLRFYIQLNEFDGFEAEALWEDLKFDREHQHQYGRTAIVGDTKTQELGTRLANLFFDPEMKFFDLRNAEEAWEWVNE